MPDTLVATPSVSIVSFRDIHGNCCNRIVAPQAAIDCQCCREGFWPDRSGRLLRPTTRAAGSPGGGSALFCQSRYCETDPTQAQAWSLFDKAPLGWGRVQAICDFVHQRIEFGYAYARSTKSAWQVLNQGRDVCRDFAHLAIDFCRCMNIPPRYCTGLPGRNRAAAVVRSDGFCSVVRSLP